MSASDATPEPRWTDRLTTETRVKEMPFPSQQNSNGNVGISDDFVQVCSLNALDLATGGVVVQKIRPA